MSRRALHSIIGLVLIACVVCPFVELAIGWQDTVFVTGYDGESTLALLVLLFELVVTLMTALGFYLLGDRTLERLRVSRQTYVCDSGREHSFGVLSPPLPLRI